MSKTRKCSRCGRRLRSAAGWNAECVSGIIIGIICPDCQTPEENAEAEIKEATLDYIAHPSGLMMSRPKVDAS